MPKRLRFFLGVFLASAQPVLANDFLLVPGERAGDIRADTSRGVLESWGGTTAKGGYAEQELMVTTVDAGKPGEIAVYWPADDNSFQAPMMACVHEQVNGASPWHTSEGIRVGMTMEKLQKILGEPFAFNGFSWDYGGMVLWDMEEHGKARSLPEITLSPKRDIEFDNKYLGDVRLYSDDAALKPLGVHIDSLCMFFVHD